MKAFQLILLIAATASIVWLLMDRKPTTQVTGNVRPIQYRPGEMPVKP